MRISSKLNEAAGLQVKDVSLGNRPGDSSPVLTVTALLLTLFLFNRAQVPDLAN